MRATSAGRVERVGAAFADFLYDGGTKPPEVTWKKAGGKLDNSAHRLKSNRPQPGRRGVRAIKQFRVTERPVDRRDYAPQQRSRVTGIAGWWDTPRQLYPAVLIMQAEERQAKQQVQVVAA